MQATMGETPLTLDVILRRGLRYFADSMVVTLEEGATRRTTFAEVGARVQRLAGVLDGLGVGRGDVVGTLLWNQQEHLEAYLAVPCMGAVLHTLNLRLSPEQLVYVINHGGDRVIIVDGSLAPLLAQVRSSLTTVEHVIQVGGAVGPAQDYEQALAGAQAHFDWPHLDEGEAAAMCYTTGTTGDPKGVVYSHRSQYLHTLGVWGNFGLSDHDRMLYIVPMFHANAWGLPYAGWMVGGDLLFPGRFLQPEPLARFMEAERVTFAGGVPTVLQGLLAYADTHPDLDLSSIRLMICGGAAVPRSLMEGFEERHGVRVIQAWGMTETSPIGTVADVPRGTVPGDEMHWRAKTGRPVMGVELRIVDESGAEVANDGEALGEIEVRGPWIATGYHHAQAPEKFHDGWLRTGDMGTVDARGYVQITDRAKDVIKSGGEWISSVEIENTLMGHPGVADAAVVGVPDARWDERPLALVVAKPGQELDPAALQEWLAARLQRWWLPERWVIVEELPKTSVGKQNKRAMRAMYAQGRFTVAELRPPSRR